MTTKFIRSTMMTALVLTSAFAVVDVHAQDFKRPSQIVPNGTGQAPIILAQSGDATFRINELEEQVRRLNGKVEELTFQLLQMQEDMRRMQQDNELRFQELEEKRSDVGSDTNKDVAQSEQPANELPAAGDNRLGKSESSGEPNPDVNDNAQTAKKEDAETPLSTRGSKPKSLGTLTFDDQGNVIDAGRPEPAIAGEKLPGVFSDGVDGGVEAAEFGPTPNAVFQAGKVALANKRYRRAGQVMSAFLKAWPKDPKESEARYVLAQSLFWQREYLKAANTYLDTHNAFPDAPTAPDNLLGLGLALAGLNQREVACVTYSEVLKQYPEAVIRLADRVQAEQAAAKC